MYIHFWSFFQTVRSMAPKGKKGKPSDGIVDKKDSNDKNVKDKKKGGPAGKGTRETVENKTEPNTPSRPTAKQLVGGSSWTGKIPVVLLNEHCQKSKWEKSDIQVKQTKSKQYIFTSARLSKRDPKNSSVFDHVNLAPPKAFYEKGYFPEKETLVEARNVGAVYALHRVLSHKSLQHALPPNYRDIWLNLEKQKKEDVKNNRQYLYHEDPFKAAKEREAEISASKQASAKPPVQRLPKPSFSSTEGTRLSGFSQYDFKHAVTLNMSLNHRQSIETLLRSLSIWDGYEKKEVLESLKELLVKDLVSLGFRDLHAKEACQYCSSLEEALEWLIIHVPEDDLPERFLPSDYNVGVSIQNNNSETLAIHYNAKRLGDAGYNYDFSFSVLQRFRNDLALAAEYLQFHLVGKEFPDKPEFSSDSITFFKEEAEALQSIYQSKVSVQEDSCKIKLNSPSDEFGQIYIEFKLPASPYPQNIPIIFISSTKRMASYIKLSIVRKLLLYAHNYVGEPMLDILYDYLQENITSFLKNLEPLLSLSSVTIGTDVSKTKDVISHMQKESKMPKLFKRDPKMDRKVYQIWLDRQKSPEYLRRTKDRETLPAFKSKETILSSLQSCQSIVISGETGSGKSTQVVQFILDHFLSEGRGNVANVVCTQPRRISAISLAERVSFERTTALGSEVGYSVHGDKCISQETLLEFCTTGLLLRRIQLHGLAYLRTLSCIVVDEVHERSIDNDILLALLKLIIPRIPNLKIVLMSATVNAESFMSYFPKSKHLHIEGRTYPIRDLYIEDFNFISDEDSNNEITKKRNGFYEVDYNLISQLVNHINSELGLNKGSILIFLPGVSNINRCMQEIKRKCGDGFEILPLHASLNTTDQRKVFKSYKKRKVICSTNVAETSITINDVVAVIDSGRVKQIDYDLDRDLVTFKETWASRAACRQRRGRAGRVQEGICFKLYSRGFEKKGMADETPPDVLRTALSQVCLSVIPLVSRFISGKDADRQGAVKKFMQYLLSPPTDQAVDTAIEKLIQVGALTENEELTGMGEYLVALPIDLKLGKLLVLASIFGFTEPALSISAVLSSKSPFLHDDGARDIRSNLSNGWGDVLTDAKAYDQWNEIMKNSGLKKAAQWCHDNHISVLSMQQIRQNRSELSDAIQMLKLVINLKYNEFSWNSSEDLSLLSAIIAGALRPNIVKCAYPDKKYVSSSSGSIEVDQEARLTKFFDQSKNRLFIHPTSVMFSNSPNPSKTTFIAYERKVETTKPFLQNCTPINTFGMALLGTNDIIVDPLGKGLILDNAFAVKAWPKVVILLKLLRRYLDFALHQRLESNQKVYYEDDIRRCIQSLIASNGT
ncbi:ATP-dependent RNA helicase Ucp1 [Schizosaccharomyces cryophilus OY26]|uniref:ATP-dependent RNA helicase Ucp1 n=1 Tax=Schizosaccharomyces cryophilus (strain OY26 / ATCC MYA-4695 / CBS 11777 / NBRC 106824 / NRRL Y48691) TaxID=653667 RepID=S9WYC6_SCHCR|nr:ATP-dependent RNA helicase Ucp1 [Schizosaccharomyces cryophilus OY26]EPY49737.1 ATP-dependent RNA helicase Ucp1 [Schizosaccharomyces cryophilus OY26]